MVVVVVVVVVVGVTGEMILLVVVVAVVHSPQVVAGVVVVVVVVVVLFDQSDHSTLPEEFAQRRFKPETMPGTRLASHESETQAATLEINAGEQTTIPVSIFSKQETRQAGGVVVGA